MNQDRNGWLPMASAQRDGQRVLVTVRGGEQGAAEVDTVRWIMPRNGHEHCWVATDTGPDALVTYEDDDLLAWMPLPSPTAAGRAVALGEVMPAREIDFLEQAGSGI